MFSRHWRGIQMGDVIEQFKPIEAQIPSARDANRYQPTAGEYSRFASDQNNQRAQATQAMEGTHLPHCSLNFDISSESPAMPETVSLDHKLDSVAAIKQTAQSLDDYQQLARDLFSAQARECQLIAHAQPKQEYVPTTEEPLRYTTQDRDGKPLHQILVSEPLVDLKQAAADLSKIDPSQLSPDAQFGGPIGSWFRYFGRAAWEDLGVLDTALHRMAEPGAADDLIFGNTVRAKHYYTDTPIDQINKDLAQLGNDAAHTVWNAPGAFERMTPDEKSKASADALYMGMFFFAGAKSPIAKEVVEQMGLKNMSKAELAKYTIETDIATMRTGERLEFSAESGITLTKISGDEADSIWRWGWAKRGFEAEPHMGRTVELASNFPAIDEPFYKEGKYVSMKSIDLNAPTYQNMEKLEKQLTKYVDKLAEWNGQLKMFAQKRILPGDVKQKVLDIAIPDGTITMEQQKVIERLGVYVQQMNIQNAHNPNWKPLNIQVTVVR